jgi:hypothetical protein
METKEFHPLILLETLDKYYVCGNGKKMKMGLYQCFCGKQVERPIFRIKSTKQRSCGCLIGSKSAKKPKQNVGDFKKEVPYTPRTLILIFLQNPLVQNIKNLQKLKNLYYQIFEDIITDTLLEELKKRI